MNFDVIIVGAGLSGSYLAKKINELGLNALIIEKSKSIGGRFSTKPVGRGLADYGCQYLKPKTKELSNLYLARNLSSKFDSPISNIFSIFCIGTSTLLGNALASANSR